MPDSLNFMTIPLQGVHLIEASAGTGKTYTIEKLYLRLVLERGLQVDDMLVVTFTEAATKELRDRLRSSLETALDAVEGLGNPTGDEARIVEQASGKVDDKRNRLRLALVSFDQAAIFTIHGFCQRMLGDYAFENRALFNMEVLPDDTELIAQVVGDFWRQYYDQDLDFLVGEADILKKLRELARVLRGNPDLEIRADAQDDVTAFLEAFTGYFHKAYPELKKRLGVLTFDDMLRLVRDGLRASPSYADVLRKRYKAAMIDEFQDTDPVQYEIFRRIFVENPDPDKAVYFIGDPKQSIYRFRGADIYAYLNAKDAVDREWELDTNYRSVSLLVDAVNLLFQQVDNPFVEKKIRFIPVRAHRQTRDIEPRMHVMTLSKTRDVKRPEQGALNKYESEYLTVKAVTAEVVRLLKHGYVSGGERKGVRPSDIAILVDTNAHAADVHNALSRAGVPSVLKRTGDVFASKEAGYMLDLMNAAAAPSDRTIRPALVSPVIGVNMQDLIDKGEDLVPKYYEHFLRFRTRWLEEGFMAMFTEMANTLELRKHTLSLADGERVLTNVLHLAELLHQAEKEGYDSPMALITWLGRRIAETRDHSSQSEEREIRLERDDEALTIATVHASKGLEYKIVFCAYEWARTKKKRREEHFVPLYDAGGHGRVLDLGKPQLTALEREREAENMRLFYVAVTRARELCYLVVPRYQILTKKGAQRRGSGLQCSPFGTLTGKAQVTEIIQTMERLDNGLFHRHQLTPDNIKIEDYQVVANKGEGTLQAEKFTGDIDREYRIASFSSLKHGAAKEIPEALEKAVEEEVLDAVEAGAADVLPKGAATGSAVHGVFEVVDFTDLHALDEVVDARVREFGLDRLADPQQVRRAMGDMVRRVLEAEIRPGLRLNTVGSGDCVKEMKFFYTLANGGLWRMGQLFEHYGRKDLLATIERLGRHDIHGFMTGSIDLLFRHGGKYYVLDWKTNHLGDSPDAYSPEAVERVMDEAMYKLQYIIYTVAADLFLRQRLGKGYDYGQDFGGVLYVFTRGIDHNRGPGHAVYHDIPDRGLVQDLEACLTGGKDA